MFTQYHEKILRRLWRYRKALIYLARRPCKDTLPVFIMGCGRSGTTMIINIFHRDHRIEALDENDPKIARDYTLDFDKIPEAISTSAAAILAMKPILNSFDASHLLKTYSKSKVLWVLRDHKDMIASSLKKFGTEVSEYMQDVFEDGNRNTWLSRGIPPETRHMISTLKASGFSPYDWMALVWWSVNRTIILDQLSGHDRFFLVKYEDLVRHPGPMLKSVYDFIGLQYQNKATKYIHAGSIGKGAAIELAPNVETLCQDLANVLISRYDS